MHVEANPAEIGVIDDPTRTIHEQNISVFSEPKLNEPAIKSAGSTGSHLNDAYQRTAKCALAI